MAYRAGGLATGLNYAALNIVNPSGVACRLTGAITLTPLDASGAAMTVAAGWRDRVRILGLALTAHEHLPAVGTDAAGGPWAQLLLAGNARDDFAAANALCPPTKIAAPHSWRLTGALTATVINYDPAALSPPHQLTACTEPGGLQLANIGYSTRP